jgi:hypothetical protein
VEVRTGPGGQLTDGTVGDKLPAALMVLLLIGLVPRIAVALLPERSFVSIVVDDAAYYLQLAKEFGQHGVPTMDGVHITNGFHPLWLLVLTPLTWVVDSPMLLLRITVLICALLGGVTFWITGRLLVPRLGTAPTTIGLAVWWLNPESVSSTASGVEAALACLLVAATATQGIRYAERPDRRRAVTFGILAGLTYLARTDAALAVAAIGAWAAVRTVRSHNAGPRTVVRHGAFAAGTAVLVTLPWFVWNGLAAGSLNQASSWAVPQVLWANQLAGNTQAPVLIGLGRAGSYLIGAGPVDIGVPLVAMAVLLGVAALALTRRIGDRSARSLLSLGLALLGALLALTVIHAGLRLLPRPYYFEWGRWSWGFLAATVAAACRDTAPVRRTLAHLDGLSPGIVRTGCVIVALGVLVHLAGPFLAPPYPWQASTLDASAWVQRNTPRHARIGAFNSGFLTLLSDRTVLNLDGVVSDAAARAIADRQLARYICSQDLQWFVDFDPAFRETYTPFLGRDARRWQLDRVATFPGPLPVDAAASPLRSLRSDCR